MRRPTLTRPSGWFAAAAVLATLAALMTVRAGGASEPGRSVLVARTVLRPGAVLTQAVAAGDVVALRVPRSLPLVGLIDPRSDLAGARIVTPVAPGEPITQATLGGAPGTGPAPLRPGERALPIPLGAVAGSLAIVAGVHVDAVAVEGTGTGLRGRIIARDVEVLGVERHDEEGYPSAAPAIALVRVTSREGVALSTALASAGEVRLLVRPAGDDGGAFPAVGTP